MSLVAVGSLDADTEMEMESWFGPGWRSDCLAMQQATAECNGLGISSCLLYTSPSPRDATLSRMPSSA